MPARQVPPPPLSARLCPRQHLLARGCVVPLVCFDSNSTGMEYDALGDSKMIPRTSKMEVTEENRER